MLRIISLFLLLSNHCVKHYQHFLSPPFASIIITPLLVLESLSLTLDSLKFFSEILILYLYFSQIHSHIFINKTSYRFQAIRFLQKFYFSFTIIFTNNLTNSKFSPWHQSSKSLEIFDLIF